MTTKTTHMGAIAPTVDGDFRASTFKMLGGLGMLLGLAIPSIGYFALAGTVPALADMGDRLAFAIRWMTVPALSVVVGFQAAGLARLSSANADGSSPPEGSPLELHRRYLQNTLEQFAYFFVTQMAFVTVLPSEALHMTPIFAVQFLVGRLLFWRGYLRNPAFRSLGLTMNHVNMFVLFYVVFRVVTG